MVAELSRRSFERAQLARFPPAALPWSRRRHREDLPPSKSLIAGPPPLYGTWIILGFRGQPDSSPARLPALPTPEVP